MKIFEIDLRYLEGSGDFHCPKCGQLISPEENSNETYKIIDIKADKQGLKSIYLKCLNCNSEIKLVGFR